MMITMMKLVELVVSPVCCLSTLDKSQMKYISFYGPALKLAGLHIYYSIDILSIMLTDLIYQPQ